MARITIDRDEQENIEWQEIPRSSPSRGPLKRRLLITTDNFLPRWDGISRFLSEIIPRLRERYDIVVVAPDYGEVVIDGVDIVRIPLVARSYGDFRPARYQYRRIARIVRSCDIVFNQALGPIGVAAILAAKRYRRPIASYIHSIEWELVPRALAKFGPMRGLLVPFSKVSARFLYNRCSVLIVPSEHVAELFSWQRIRTPKRIANLGVDTKKFAPADKRAVREELKLPQDAFIVGYHGRIAHEKNLITLLRGFRRLQAKNKLLLIVGDGVPAIKARLQRHHDIIITGSTNHVVPWLQAMDAYVQPSFTETTSLAVLEAMACGLPVVSSRVGFIKHYLVDGQNGMFFDNTNPHDLSVKLKQLHDDRISRSSLGLAARKTVEQRFNWEKTAQDIIDALDSI